MTLPLICRSEARHDLHEITGYIADRNPSAPDRIGTAVENAAERLPDHPLIHRPGRVPGTREAIVHLVYRVGETIDILAVLHARQQYS